MKESKRGWGWGARWCPYSCTSVTGSEFVAWSSQAALGGHTSRPGLDLDCSVLEQMPAAQRDAHKLGTLCREAHARSVSGDLGLALPGDLPD